MGVVAGAGVSVAAMVPAMVALRGAGGLNGNHQKSRNDQQEQGLTDMFHGKSPKTFTVERRH
jgi:hypothetical protein